MVSLLTARVIIQIYKLLTILMLDLKELCHDILSRFLCRAKLPSACGKLQNISLVRQKNTKEVIINREGTRMVKDGED